MSSSPSHNGFLGVGVETTRRPGDWQCGGCEFINFPNRQFCFKCGMKRGMAPDGGKNPPDWYAFGTFKSFEWNCDSCFALNRSCSDYCSYCGVRRLMYPPPESAIIRNNINVNFVDAPKPVYLDTAPKTFAYTCTKNEFIFAFNTPGLEYEITIAPVRDGVPLTEQPEHPIITRVFTSSPLTSLRERKEKDPRGPFAPPLPKLERIPFSTVNVKGESMLLQDPSYDPSTIVYKDGAMYLGSNRGGIHQLPLSSSLSYEDARGIVREQFAAMTSGQIKDVLTEDELKNIMSLLTIEYSNNNNNNNNK